MFATRHSGFASPFGPVVLVASLGGLQAFITLLAGLPAAVPVPAVVGQARRHPFDGDARAAVRGRTIGLPVRVAASGMPARPGVVIAGATTATIASTGCWVLADERRYRRPGDAVRARSAGAAAAIAVILTGYVAAPRGAGVVTRRGGRVVVPDQATARAEHAIECHRPAAPFRAGARRPLDRAGGAGRRPRRRRSTDRWAAALGAPGPVRHSG
jgi:two-component system, chemotaxis family, protein-glutamate methylesterase/glutaminase